MRKPWKVAGGVQYNAVFDSDCILATSAGNTGIATNDAVMLSRRGTVFRQNNLLVLGSRGGRLKLFEVFLDEDSAPGLR